MSSLYTIAAEYTADIAKLADLNLPPEAVVDTVDAMQGEVTEKIKAVLIVAMRMDGEAALRKQHGDRMIESAKAIQARADGLRSYAQIAIQNCGVVTPISYPEFTVALQPNPPSAEVSDEGKVPWGEFRSCEVTFTLRVDPEQFVSGVAALLEKPNMSETRAALDMAQTKCVEKVDRRQVLAALKTGHVIPGARMAPKVYRIVIK